MPRADESAAVTAIRGQVVLARDVVPGDRVILPMLGARVVLQVDEYPTLGLEATPCLVIVYASHGSIAFENRASAAKGMSRIDQAEGSLRPYLPDDPVAIERREQ